METKIFTPPYGIQNTFIATTYLGNLMELYNIENLAFKNMSGAGTSIDKEEAKILSIYEAIERVGNTLNTRDIVIDSFNNLKENCFDLNKFPQVADFENSPNIPFLPDQIIGWVKSYNLIDKKDYLIPQNYVFLYNSFNFFGDKITNPISTGVALHNSYTQAIISGIYEVIERDGISITWLLHHVKYRVNHIFNEEYHKVFSSDFLGEVNYYDVSTVEGVITICAHAKSYYSRKVKNVLMFASDTNIDNIKKKLYKELISVMSSFSISKKYSPDDDYTKFVSVDQSGSYMAQDFNDKYFEFFNLIEDNPQKKYEKKNFMSYRDELKYLVDIMKKQDYDILTVDLSTREAIEEDFRVVRVIIPQLQPISFVYKSKYLDSNRLQYFQEKLNKEDINIMPLAFS